MALFFTILLGISLVGLIGVIALKRWELASGKVVMSAYRPGLGERLGNALLFVERGIPFLVRLGVTRGYHAARARVQRAVAWSVIHLEHGLERLLRQVRGATAVRRDGAEASAFLREVAQHKKTLKKSVKKRAIYEE